MPQERTWPLVSAVIPTVDRPELLKRAVRAVLRQDYPGEIECIVVFDGTPPVMPDVEQVARRTVRVLQNNRTAGLAGNRNTGYLAARGEFVASCDDDDEWLPGKLSSQVERLSSRSDANAVASGFFYHYRGKDMERGAASAELTFDDFLDNRHMEANASTYLVRRSALIGAVGLVDEQLPGGYAEDYELMLRAARTGPVLCVQQPLSRVYLHESSNFADKWATIDDALGYLLARYPEFSRAPRGLARLEGQRAFAQAALGRRGPALRLAGTSLRRSWRVKQSWAAGLVALRLVSARRVLATAQRFGHGI